MTFVCCVCPLRIGNRFVLSCQMPRELLFSSNSIDGLHVAPTRMFDKHCKSPFTLRSWSLLAVLLDPGLLGPRSQVSTTTCFHKYLTAAKSAFPESTTEIYVKEAWCSHQPFPNSSLCCLSVFSKPFSQHPHHTLF